MRDGERLGKASGLETRKVVVHRYGRSLLDDRHLGLTASAHDCHDTITDRESLDVGPDSRYHARELEAWNIGRKPWRRRVEARTLQQVSAVQACRLDRDKKLAPARNGIRSIS